jgi:hypothetical protein
LPNGKGIVYAGVKDVVPATECGCRHIGNGSRSRRRGGRKLWVSTGKKICLCWRTRDGRVAAWRSTFGWGFRCLYRDTVLERVKIFKYVGHVCIPGNELYVG